MKKAALLFVFIFLLLPGMCMAAASKQVSLSAGSSSIVGDFNVKFDTDFGYLKPGVEIKYYDKDNEEFTIIDGKFLAGSESLYPGLTCELGFRGLLGNVKQGAREGDLGGIGFFGLAAYSLSERISPIPIEFLAALTFAPTPLSFLDLDKYWELRFGVNFYFVEQAAIMIDYRHYMIDMDNSHGKWDIDEGTFTFGIKLSW